MTPEERRAYHRRWSRRWRLANPEKAKEKSRNGSRIWRQSNRERHREMSRAHYHANKAAIIAEDREQRTGWSIARFEAAWLAQEGKCSICQIQMLKSGRSSRSVACDHCHEEKQPRQLLCSMCNKGLGCFKDSPDRLRAAADYVEFHGYRGDEDRDRDDK